MSKNFGLAIGGLSLLIVCLAGCDAHSQDGSQLVLGRGYADNTKARSVDHSAFSDRVLIIRDPDALEDLSYDPYPTVEGSLTHVASFRSVIEKAGGKHFNANNEDYEWKLPTATMDRMMGLWHTCADETTLCLDAAPLRLLAVIFRPDLADFRCGNATEGHEACGTEMRFEFGLTDESGASLLAIIVEFVAPRQTKLQFQEMVGSWRNLSGISEPRDLAAAVAEKWTHYAGLFSSSRIRLSALKGNAWDVRQYSFDSTGRLKIADRLPEEIDRNQWIHNCNLTQAAVDFLASGADPNKLPSALLKPAMALFDIDPLEIGSKYSPNLRFALALRSCSGCHSRTETGTPVLHISPRKHHQKSQLSSFLTGISTPAYGEPTTGYYSVPDPGTCSSDHPRRSFNDLLRRELYIDTVLSFKASDTDWTTKLRDGFLSISSVE